MIPTEYEEQVAFRQWLDIKGYPYFRVPNETYTTSHNQRRKNMALGVKPGVPDMFVCVAGKMVAVELKRIKGGTTSEHQKQWIATLNANNVPTAVCKGADAAIAFIQSMIK